MAPRRKSKVLSEGMTPKASAQDEENTSMDVDTPKQSETPRAADTPAAIKQNLPTEEEILQDLWTEDQTSSLFKAIIRWKPSGMHKHFRMIAISEHLRNHGFDPRIETHTRIPGIWQKLRQFFDMDMIDERDNSFDYVRSLGGEEAPEELYKDFELPAAEFHDAMWARAAANENEPDNWTDSEDEHASASKKAARKRRRRDTDAGSVAGSAATKTRRNSIADDSDLDTAGNSSPVVRGARRARSKKRAPAKGKAENAESEDDEDEDEEEEDDDEEDSSEEEEEEEAPAARSSRGGRGRGRGRGRVKGGRKKA